jgi:exopolysaccharide production protein ExoQ
LLLLIVFILAQPFYFLYPLYADGLSPSDKARLISTGGLEREAGLLLLALFAIVSLRRYRRSGFRAHRCLSWPVLLFLSWACMSIIWSDDPSLTVRRVGSLLILCLGAVAVAKSFSSRSVLLFTFVAGMATVVGGLFSELALGTFHPFEAEYRFAGIMNPNFTGWNCSLCLIAIVALARNKPRLVRQAYALVFVGVAGCMLLTKSRGALAGACLGLLIYFILVSSRRRIETAVLMITTITCSIFLLGVLFPGYIGGANIAARLTHALLLGRTEDPTTLTGRLPFWEGELLPYFIKRPTAGYGYGSFWTAGRFEQQASAASPGVWFFPDAHNSVIEVALSLGAVGLALYITVFAAAVYLSVRASDSSPGCMGPFAAGVLVCSFVNSCLSSEQLEPYLGSFVYFIVIAYIAFSEHSAGRQPARRHVPIGETYSADTACIGAHCTDTSTAGIISQNTSIVSIGHRMPRYRARYQRSH